MTLKSANLRVFRNGIELALNPHKSRTTDWESRYFDTIDGIVAGLFKLHGKFECIQSERINPGEILQIEHLDFRQEFDIIVLEISVDINKPYRQSCTFRSNGRYTEQTDKPIVVEDKHDNTRSDPKTDR